MISGDTYFCTLQGYHHKLTYVNNEGVRNGPHEVQSTARTAEISITINICFVL